MDTTGQIIAGLVTIGAAFATWLVSKRREANKQAREKNDLSKAVHEGDKDKVNSHLRNSLCVAGLLLAGAGCNINPGTAYVAADREVYPMVSTNNIPGWFVPNATMDDISRKLYDYSYSHGGK
jgi:hypothetical protein